MIPQACKSSFFYCHKTLHYGGQQVYGLGERLNGIQDVSGSIPLISIGHLVILI